MLGSKELDKGNSKYEKYTEDELDFSGGSMCGSNVMYCNEMRNKINKDVNSLSLEEFKKKYGESWEKVSNFLMDEIFSEKHTNKTNDKNINNSGKKIKVNTVTKTNKSSNGSNVKNCDAKCQADFTNYMNSTGIENTREKYSYYPAYNPDMEETYYELRGGLANLGIVLMGSGIPVGGALVIPKALDYLGGSIYSFQDGDVEGGLKNLAGLVTLGIVTGLLYQNSVTTSTQSNRQNNSKLFNGDGQYKLPNGTSVVEVSGNNVGRINYVNGVPNNYYGVVDGKFVMGNVSSGGIGSLTNSLNSGQVGLPSVNNSLGLPMKYVVDTSALNHASLGDFTYDNKTGDLSKVKGGGHGQENIDFLLENNLTVNINKTYPNGVRVGNIPDHKTPSKRTGENQAWFPENWSNMDIKNAGNYVSNLSSNINAPDGVIIWGEYKGVRVGVIKTNGKPGTVFPDTNAQPSK